MPRTIADKWFIQALCGLLLAIAVVDARAEPQKIHGQLLYVPVYSEVPYGDKAFTLNLTATLSVRNPDLKNPINLKRIDYYSASGTLVRSYLKQATLLKPMASTEFIVRESDRSGGISASFLIEWESDIPSTPPFVEAIMVNSTYNQGIAFNSTSRVLSETP